MNEWLMTCPLEETDKEHLEFRLGKLSLLSSQPNEYRRLKDSKSLLYEKREEELMEAFKELKATISFFEERFKRALTLEELAEFEGKYLEQKPYL